MKQMPSFARAFAWFFLAVMAAVTPLHSLAAEPQSAMVQSVTRGNMVLTRSITADNVLTHSSCVVQVTADLTEQRCTSESSVLSDDAAAAVREAMRLEAARTVAEAHAAMRSMSDGIGASRSSSRSYGSQEAASMGRSMAARHGTDVSMTMTQTRKR